MSEKKKKDLMDVTIESAKRAILNLLDCLTPEILVKAIQRDATLLKSIPKIPQPYRRNVLAVLGVVRTIAQIYPRPKLDEAIKQIVEEMKKDYKRFWWVLRILEHPKAKLWFVKQIKEFIDWIWGDAHA